MKIAIHNSKTGFHPHWIAYCAEKQIPFKLVDCYADDLIDQLRGCQALMWHHGQQNPKDLAIAKQILFALEHTGLQVFPNFNTAWHFDDKLGQKYLFERLGLPFVPTYAFYEKETALSWAKSTTYPKVFKLRGGAGSSNVKLVYTQKQAIQIIKKAFGSGFSNYNAWDSLKERWYKFRKGKASIHEPIKGLLRFFQAPPFAKALGKEYHYVYFQDFIPKNEFDLRIIVIGNKAFGLKRLVRDGDFRASGSGVFEYDLSKHQDVIQIAFTASSNLNANCAAFDFIYDSKLKPLIVEVSYGFGTKGSSKCPGYWDRELNWHEGKFNPQGWMVEIVNNKIT
ncbi:MAG: hypothetical protein LAT68_11385 [Cyclobacteriaceae bacterium]|nr:hypothetical protein [Cyclobacteriaceae bacterium]MCH8516919.1 hypothetical protein [Cyclobacteriaceae bacterium]